MSPLPAFRNRLGRPNQYLFNWAADDGEATFARSGQVGAFTRPSASTAETATGTIAVAQQMPRWTQTDAGIALLLLPSDEVLRFPCLWYQQAVSVYLAGYTAEPVDMTSATTRLFRLGDGAAASLELRHTLPSAHATAIYVDGSGAPTAALTTDNPVLGDFVEYFVTLDAAWKVRVQRSVNGDTVNDSGLSAAGAAFAAATLHGGILAFADGAGSAGFAYRSLRVRAGTAGALDDERGAAV